MNTTITQPKYALEKLDAIATRLAAVERDQDAMEDYLDDLERGLGLVRPGGRPHTRPPTHCKG